MARYQYQIELSHAGLNKYRIVKAETVYELNCKADAIRAQWDAQWQRIQKKAHQEATEQALRSEADQITTSAEHTHSQIENFLLNTLTYEPLSFSSIRNAYKPSKAPPVLKLVDLPKRPMRSDARFNPPVSLFTRLFRAKAHTSNCQQQYNSAVRRWEEETTKVNIRNAQLREAYTASLAELDAERQAYLTEVDTFENEFISGSVSAMNRFVALLLGAMMYPFPFEHELATHFDIDARLLIVDVFLPAMDDFPTLKQATYVKSRNAISEKHFSSTDLRKKYNAFTYQITLASLHRLYSSIPSTLVDSIVLNGYVRTIDKATGQPITPCILSIRTSRSDLSSINLYNVDPVAWFKHNKGMSAASFADVTPVAPILSIQRDDKRFVDGYSVIPQLENTVNLAAMDWLDFENLIRELFEQEFSQNGGEVHITQASRDGGVDAVAFDPDPIRGGKIIIQAKRYTNVVGVSAVRDLYGTVNHEGAMKGILVTTSTYGKDAYDFIVGKPLTLINGSQLLFLLEKHGHSAHIDIAEARARNTPSSD